MDKKETLTLRAARIKEELDKLINENSFSYGDISLDLQYNPWHKENKLSAYIYYLKVRNNAGISMTFEELAKLKEFLNSVI